MEFRGEVVRYKPLIDEALAVLPNSSFVTLEEIRELSPPERRGVGAFLFYSGVPLETLDSLARRALFLTRLPETLLEVTGPQSAVLAAAFRALFCEGRRECDTPLGATLLDLSDPSRLLSRPLPATYFAPFFPQQSIRVQTLFLAGLSLSHRGLLPWDFPRPQEPPTSRGLFFFLSPLTGAEESRSGSLTPDGV